MALVQKLVSVKDFKYCQYFYSKARGYLKMSVAILVNKENSLKEGRLQESDAEESQKAS